MRKFRDQQQRQSRRVSQNGGKKHILSVSQLQLLDDKQFSECYVNIKDLSTNKSIKSANFYNALFGVWQVQVGGPSLQFELFMNKDKTGYKKISQVTLTQASQTIYLSSLSINKKKIGILVYKIRATNEGPKESKRSLARDNIFNIDQNQISRVQKKLDSKSEKRLQQERVGFHDGISFASSIMDDEKMNMNSKISKKSKDDDQRKGLYVNDDSVVQQILSHFGKSRDLEDESKNDEGANEVNKENEMRKDEQKQKQNLEKIKQNPNQSVEEEELLTTAEKWYQKKFNKKNISKFRRKNYAPISASESQKPFSKKVIQVVSHNEKLIDNEEVVRQLSDMSTDQHIKLKTIDFSLSSDEGSQKLYSLSRNDGKSSSLWYTAISIPTKGLISIQCQDEQQHLNGCLGTSEIKKGQCPLYDPEGTIIGNLNFKSRTICNSTAQTHDFLMQIGNDDNEDEQRERVDRKQSIENPNQEKESRIEKKSEDMNRAQGKVHDEKKNNLENEGIEQLKEENPSKLFIPAVEPEEKEMPLSRREQGRPVQSPESLQLEERPKSRESARKISPELLQSRSQSPILKESEPHQKKQEEQRRKSQEKDKNSNQNIKSERISQLYDRIKKRNDEEMQSNEEHIEDKKNSKLKSVEKEPITHSPQVRQGEQQKRFRKTRYAEQPSTNPLAYQEYNPNKSPNSNNPINFSIVSNDHEDRVSKFPPKRRQGVSIAIPKKNNEYSQRQRSKYSNGFSYRKGDNQNSIIDQYNDHLHRSQRQDRLRRNLTNNEQEEKSFQYVQEGKRGIHETFFKNHRVNFQVKVVEINVTKCNLKPKFTKIEIDNNKFYTQSTNHVYHCRWQSEGYIFPSTYQYTKLHISLFQENQDGIVGKCSIPLAYLKLNIPNIDFQYSEYMTNERLESVGRLHIVYRVIDRKTKAMSYEQNDETYKYLNNQNNLMDEGERKKKKKKRKDKQRYSTQISATIRQSRSIMESRNRNYPFMESLSKGSFGMARRKYTGGNILIPKASRFVQPNISKIKKNDPGPGSYEMVSMFDRHAVPY